MAISISRATVWLLWSSSLNGRQWGSDKYGNLDNHLFTFCPPGPHALLNEMSQRRRGITFWSKLESHALAAFWSSSEGSFTLSVLLDSGLDRLSGNLAVVYRGSCRIPYRTDSIM